MKKFLVLALSLCMVLALCVCGYAEDEHDANPVEHDAEKCLAVEGFHWVTGKGCYTVDCEAGTASIHWHCSVCGDVMEDSKQSVTFEKGHTILVKDAQDPTCQAAGWTEGKYCGNKFVFTWEDQTQTFEAACGHWEVESTPLAKVDHAAAFEDVQDVYDYIAAERAAGHTIYCDGVESKVTYCKFGCGTKLADSLIFEVEHNWRPVTDPNYAKYQLYQAPTCEDTGLYSYEYCLTCGTLVMNGKVYHYLDGDKAAYQADRIIPALNHKNADGSSALKPMSGSLGSCTAPAYKDYMQCELCDATFSEGVEMPAPGHTWTVYHAAKEPGCKPNEKGNVEHYTCAYGCEGAYAIWSEAVEDWQQINDPYIYETGHDWKTILGVAPTCTEPGHAAYEKCRKCNAVSYNGADVVDQNKLNEQVQIPKTGHLWEPGIMPITDPTSYVIIAREANKGGELYEISDFAAKFDAIAADWDAYYALAANKRPVSFAATCEKDGYAMATYCPWCGMKYTEAKVLPKTEHNYEIVVEGEVADCEKAGVSDYYECQNECCQTGKCQCEAPTKGGDPINAWGHNLTKVVGKMPTCSEPGMYTWYYCTNEDCNHAEIAWYEVDIRTTSIVPPSVTKTMIDATYVVDEETGEVWLRNQFVYIPAFYHGLNAEYLNDKGQSYVTSAVPGVAPTCTEPGLADDGVICTMCDEWVVAPTVLDPTGHFNNGFDILLPAVPSNCTEAGTYLTKYCYDCECILSFDARGNELGCLEVDMEEFDPEEDMPEFTIDPADGHVEKATKYQAPTCTESGLAADGLVCEKCLVPLKDATVLPALGHDLEELVPGKEPTCTEAGYLAKVWCKVCGTKNAKNEKVPTMEDEDGNLLPYNAAQAKIDKLGHIAGEKIPATAPGCTIPGNKEGLKCGRCDEYIVEPVEIPATNHGLNPETGVDTLVYVEWVDATCDTDGHMDFIYCSNPDCDYVAPSGEGFDWGFGAGPVILKVEFDEDGEVIIPEDLVLEHLGHDWKTYARREPTCTTYGVIGAKTCKREGCGYSEPEQYIKPLGHDVQDVSCKATCEEVGYEGRFACVREDCDYVKVAGTVLPALNHAPVHMEEIAPSCTSVGYTEGYKCENCDEYTSGGEEIEMIDHIPGEWEIKVEPTYGPEGQGLKVKKCTECGETLDTGLVPPLTTGLLGDVNGDGKVSAFDALRVLQYTAKIINYIDETAADFNKDGKVTAFDALAILNSL